MEVSVIIPVYNAEKFVSKAVESALAHDCVRELLLVEDGSPDDSLATCRDLVGRHERVTLLRHPDGVNKGAGASRNLGVKHAGMEYIAFLDADDRYTDIRFEREREVFAGHPDCDGVYGAIGVDYVDEVGARAWESKGLDERSLTTVNKPVPSDALFDHLVGLSSPSPYEGYFSIDGLTLKRASLLNARVLFDESLRLHQDTVFIMQLAYKLKLLPGEISKPLAMRSVHANNRFIRNTDVGGSRLLQYRSLLNWAASEQLAKPYQHQFASRFINFLVATSNPLSAPLRFMRELVANPALRKNLQKYHVRQVLRCTFQGNRGSSD